MWFINTTGRAATQITGWHSILFILPYCTIALRLFVESYYTLFYCLLFIFSDFWPPGYDANKSESERQKPQTYLKNKSVSENVTVMPPDCGNAFSSVCLSVGLSRSCSNFRKPWPRSIIFGVPCNFRVFRPSSHIKVFESRPRSREQNGICQRN